MTPGVIPTFLFGIGTPQLFADTSRLKVTVLST